MSAGVATLLLFAFMIGLLALGTPVGFALGGLAVFFTLSLWSPEALGMIPHVITGISRDFILVALPLFVFMGVMLERSGVADNLFEMMNHWIGTLRGGLAVGTIWISTIFAAMVGTSSASTFAVGTAALPAMRRRNYDKSMILGTIQAGGALGILIPPSATFIVYGVFAGESVGKLFAGGVFPGLLLSFLFTCYIVIRCFFQPHLGPAPLRGVSTWEIRFTSLKAAILPLLLVILVLGAMFTGIATPTEAAAAGATGAFMCSVIYRKLTWVIFKESCYRTLNFMGMALWIMMGAKCFSSVYVALGGVDLVRGIFLSMPFGGWGALIAMQLVIFILGMLMDTWAIIMICTPVFVPVITFFGFDTVWFGVLFIINLEMAYLTPPFGFNLFYMKALTSVIAKDITMGDIYQSVGPFVALQALGLVIVMIFPEIALWFPNLIFES